MNATPELVRRRSLFERHWPWLLLGVLGLGALGAWQLLLGLDALSTVSDWFVPILRGYTASGVLLGVVTLALLAIVSFYSLRKRWLQEHLPLFRGTMASWLWAHVYFGLFALATACAHAGYGAFSWQLSTGKVLLVSVFVLVLSGVLWRLIYAFVPSAASKRVGNYSELASLERAAELAVEIEKHAAGRSASFHALKQRLQSGELAPEQIEHARSSLPEPEWHAARELAALVRDHRAALERRERQARYTRLLQGFRVLHVPVVLCVVALLPLHVLLAYDVPARLVEPGLVPGTTLGGFETSASCERCHENIVAQWRSSMHARAMTSPLMIAQTNQAVRESLHGAGELQKVCVNCHGPLGAALSGSATLPLPDETLGDRELLNDGISCVVCHQWRGEPETGSAAHARFAAGLAPGHTYFGPIGNPVGNAFHRSEPTALFSTSEQLCRNCHAVQLDKNHDGRFDKGRDLVLQTLFDEWAEYRKRGGASCVDCHMPIVRAQRVAEAATPFFEQDRDAPPRVLRDHSFIGVDHPLDVAPERDPGRAARAALLESAAALELEPSSVRVERGQLAFAVRITNKGVGHYLPGGFAFVRQMWLEVQVKDASGNVLGSSGVLANPSDDLCDASVIDDPNNPMRSALSGCGASDPLLANFQQQLVDKVEVAKDGSGRALVDERGQFRLVKRSDGREVAVQYLDGGPVARRRPFDKQALSPLAPGEARLLPYRFALSAGALQNARVEVRLLFRAVSPYFVRSLASVQPTVGGVALLPMLKNIEVFEMAALSRAL